MKINEFIEPSQVVIVRHPSDKIHLLDHLARRAAAALDLPNDLFFHALWKREELGSTGTGEGVAFPHARVPGVIKPFGMLARLSRAIEFDAIDGEPVDIVCLRDAETRRQIRGAADDAEVYRSLMGIERPGAAPAIASATCG
jgi:nitrogen PTS system EIIA component